LYLLNETQGQSFVAGHDQVFLLFHPAHTLTLSLQLEVPKDVLQMRFLSGNKREGGTIHVMHFECNKLRESNLTLRSSTS
jgi:hypothetical protein